MVREAAGNAAGGGKRLVAGAARGRPDSQRSLSLAGTGIRGTLRQLYGDETAERVRIQYGGSVTVENIADFMRKPDIDGALVGGASLKPTWVELTRRAAVQA